jgi:hypothetical protein
MSMTKIELDDALYGAMTDALSNSGIPIASRAKARIAGELTAEALRMVMAQMKADGTVATPPGKIKRTRGPNKPKAPALPAQPADATTPAPFGAARQ